MLIGDGVQSVQEKGFQGITVEWFYVLVPVVIALATFIVAWWRELLGGILLVVAYLVLSFAPSVHSFYYGEGPHFYSGMFFFAAPFLVCGILFIIAARLSQQV
jgi:hypothetical protein